MTLRQIRPRAGEPRRTRPARSQREERNVSKPKIREDGMIEEEEYRSLKARIMETLNSGCADGSGTDSP